jgi:hypothetical protein
MLHNILVIEENNKNLKTSLWFSKICGSHGGEYKGGRLLGCSAM